MPTVPSSCSLTMLISQTLPVPHVLGTVTSLGLLEPTKQAVLVTPKQGLRQRLWPGSWFERKCQKAGTRKRKASNRVCPQWGLGTAGTPWEASRIIHREDMQLCIIHAPIPLHKSCHSFTSLYPKAERQKTKGMAQEGHWGGGEPEPAELSPQLWIKTGPYLEHLRPLLFEFCLRAWPGMYYLP